jgi:hypothetical protein
MPTHIANQANQVSMLIGGSAHTRRFVLMGTEWKQAMTTTNHGHGNRQTEDELKSRDGNQRIICPITGRLCEGDLAYLCPDYGCARKGGLSPPSEENF